MLVIFRTTAGMALFLVFCPGTDPKLWIGCRAGIRLVAVQDHTLSNSDHHAGAQDHPNLWRLESFYNKLSYCTSRNTSDAGCAHSSAAASKRSYRKPSRTKSCGNQPRSPSGAENQAYAKMGYASQVPRRKRSARFLLRNTGKPRFVACWRPEKGTL